MLRFKDLREDKDLTGKEISQILNISPSHYSRIENGVYQLDYNGLRTLALFYNTSIDYILGITNDIKPHVRNEIKSIEDIKNIND